MSQLSRLAWRGILMSVGLLLVAAAAWSWFRPLEAALIKDTDAIRDTLVEPAVAEIEAVTVRRGELSLRREATGYLKAIRSVEIASESGGRVVEKHVAEGQRVAAGQVLVRLDSRDRRLEVLEAEAEWLKTRARYAVEYGLRGDEEWVAAEKGPEELYAQGLISKQALEQARRGQGEALLSGDHQNEVRSATSGLAQAEHRLQRANLALERTEIVAPFAGRIADLEVDPGQHVAPGDILLVLVDDANLEVDVDVLESDIVKLCPADPASVRVPALDGLTLDGRVRSINPRVDPETGTGRVTLTFANPGGTLMPGLFAYVDLETGRLADRLLVPAAAVLERQDRELVFRVENGKALWTYVTTGTRSGGWVEVSEGLEAGHEVAVAGHFALAHEAAVEVIR
ncbi:MAG: efflux RND transporter periplasmic adaptor subunit [Acidobacteriota bacterium]